MCVLTCVCDKPQSQIDLNEPSRWQRVSLDIELGSDSGCAVASGCGADFDFGFGVCGTAWLAGSGLPPPLMLHIM